MSEKVLKKREEISEEFKWKIEKVFKDSEEWEKEFGDLQKEVAKYESFQGKLSDKEEILNYLEFNEKVSRKAESLYVYAHLKCDEDTTNQKS